MDKISRILAPSARVISGEVAESQPARPGAPALGRPMGKNSLGDRITLSKKAIESQVTGLVPEPEAAKTYKNNSESSKIKMIEKLNQNFFNPKLEARDGENTTSSEQVLKSIEESDVLAPKNIVPELSRPTSQE